MVAENNQGQIRCLIIIPGSVNYFYNQCGRRLQESLLEIGVDVTLATLETYTNNTYDICIFTNIHESLFALGNEKEGMIHIQKLIASSKATVTIAIDCVSTPWYGKTDKLAKKLGIGKVIDLGLCDQSSMLTRDEKKRYRFLFSGLTPSEDTMVRSIDSSPGERKIPWAFIGHSTRFRVAVVDLLIQEVAPDGFVYMPSPAPYTEKGSPHLNQQQYELVLTKAKYQIWTSHHTHFYMEPERYRTSLITGGVPIKIMVSRDQVLPDAPFQWSMTGVDSIKSAMKGKDFSEMRTAFVKEWQTYPSLSQELESLLAELNLIPEMRLTDPERVNGKSSRPANAAA